MSFSENFEIVPKVVRPKQAARYLGIGLSTFWKYVSQGKIPRGTKISPKCTVFKLKDLDKFLDEAEIAQKLRTEAVKNAD
jgi:predicted DNA-binding transcriptional regulator AlpA